MMGLFINPLTVATTVAATGGGVALASAVKLERGILPYATADGASLETVDEGGPPHQWGRASFNEPDGAVGAGSITLSEGVAGVMEAAGGGVAAGSATELLLDKHVGAGSRMRTSLRIGGAVAAAWLAASLVTASRDAPSYWR